MVKRVSYDEGCRLIQASMVDGIFCAELRFVIEGGIARLDVIDAVFVKVR